ncbi:hypothetical protein EIA20_27090, partial [Escherichia coli]
MHADVGGGYPEDQSGPSKFPLIWMIRLSFTNLNLSMSYLPLRFVGLDNFRDILTDEDVWFRLQTTAQFVISSVALQVVVGFGL